jgi:hypothetical protein
LGFGFWVLGFPPPGGVACPLLNGSHAKSCNRRAGKIEYISGDFWLRLLNDEQLSACDDLEKLVIGCEIIAALDIVDLIAA